MFPDLGNGNDDNSYDSENPDLEVPDNVDMDEDMPGCSKEVCKLVILLSHASYRNVHINLFI